MPGTDPSPAAPQHLRRPAAAGLLAVVASLGVVVVVALLATGSTADPARMSSRPIDPTTLLDVLFVVMVVYSAVVMGVLVVAMVRAGKGDGRSTPGPRWLAMIQGMVLMGVVLWLILGRDPPERTVVIEPAEIVFDPPSPTGAEAASAGTTPWLWLVALALAVAAGAIAWFTMRGAKAAPPGVVDPGEELRAHQRSLADLFDSAIDDLRTHPDPRRAVIATFARLEAGLGAVGLPRQVADTPQRVLRRVLDHVEVSAPAAERLVGAYEEAHFSPHAVTRDTQLEAVEALAQVRDELRALAHRHDPGAATTVAGVGAS